MIAKPPCFPLFLVKSRPCAIPPLFLLSLHYPFCCRPVLLSARDPQADPRLLLRPLPGLQADGTVLLPNQWSLRPAGKQVEAATFPSTWPCTRTAIGPRCCIPAMVRTMSSSSISSRRGRVACHLPKTFYGLCFTPDGKRLLVSGGEDDVVYRFHFADG